MENNINPLSQEPAVDVRNEEWYGSANAIFNAHVADHYNPGQPGGYSSYIMEARRYKSNLDPLQTMGYLHAQEAIDSNWEYARELGKSFYNGSMGVVRDTLNGIRAARDYNIALLNEQAAAQGIERNPDQRFVEALDDAAKAQVLQPYDVKQSASAAGQLGLDLAQGAGQLAAQMAVSIPADAVLPGVGGLAVMVGQITGGQYEDLKAKGVDTKRAAEAAFANAMIQAPFERLSLTRLMRKIPAGTVFKKKVKMVLEDMFTEGVTEAIQQFPEEWAELWAINPDKSWKELQEMAAKKFPDTLQNALYAGLIGGILGAGSRGIHIALDRNINIALRKELHDERIQTMGDRIDKIKQSGISPDYAAETINANLNNATVLIDGDTLHAYAQKAGAEKVAEKLGVTAETISEAARKGDTVEVNQGNFEAVAASSPDFFETVRDAVSFDSKDISNRKYDTIQTNIERYSNLEEEQRKDLKAEVDKIAASMEKTGVPKGQIAGMKAMLTAYAIAIRPDNPAQFLRDNALRYERGVTRMTQPSLNFSSREDDLNLVKDILTANYENPRAEVENRLKQVEEQIRQFSDGERTAENEQEMPRLARQRDVLRTLLNDVSSGEGVTGVPSIEDYKNIYDRENGTFSVPKPGQYKQAMTNLTINLDEEVVPINLDEKIPYLSGLSKSALEAYIREIASHWKPVPIGELNKLLRFSDSTDKYGQRHVIYSNPMRRNKINVEVLGELLSNYDTFKEVIKNARLVEVTPNTKKEEITNKMGRSSREHAVHKGKVNQYYRFFLPVIHNNQGYTLVLTCEEHNGELQLSKDESLHLYEMSTVGINNKRSTDPERSSATRAHPSGIPAPKYNIRQMLKNVKGIDGKPYIDKNGMPNWGETVQQLEGPLDHDQYEEESGTRVEYNQETTGEETVTVDQESQGLDLNNKEEVVNFVNSLTLDDLPTVSLNEGTLNELKTTSKEELLNRAVKKLEQLVGKKIKDPLGEEVYFEKGEDETTLQKYALHLLAGQDQPIEKIHLRRAIALELAEETVKDPLAIIIQPQRDEAGNSIPGVPGRKVYIAIFKDQYLSANNIIVGVEEGQKGRIITSFAAAGDRRHKNKALTEFKKSISAAVQVLYLGLGLSGHPRPATEQRASTGDASLRSSGKQIISQENNNSNSNLDPQNYNFDALYQSQQQDQGSEIKGSFDPFTKGEGVIRLFEGADASTVIHETGHYYIETMWREIEAGRASKQQQADFETLMKYCGLTTEQWAKMDRKGREAAHERLAEAIETYIMEDKAPTRELRPVFKRFAKWLKAVYAAISRNKNAVPLTDEVREVFDRLLSAQEDVEEMRRVEGYFDKLPSVITDNLSDATKRRIEDYILKAQDKAVEILTKERLANFSETRKREIENYRNMITDEVRQEVANRPLYVAARQAQELLGGDKHAAARSYATMYLSEKMSDENEVKWEIVAEQNGMTPSELAQKLLEEPTETEAYKSAMDEAVRKEYPDYYTEREQAEEAARMAMYNDESGILLGVEQVLIEDFAMKAAAQQRSAETARKLAMAKRQQAKVAAQKELARMKVKDATRVDRFIAAERRCAEKSAEAMAKKDYETARQYKDMQAFNHACVIESANLRKRVEQYEKFLKRQFRSKRETWTNEMHFNQAAALFARMGLLRKDYDPTTRTQSLLDYLNEMGEMLYAFNEVPDWLADDTWPITDPKNMSFDDYEKVIDLIRYIKTMAKIEKAANFFDSSSTYQDWKANAIENLNKLATKFAPVLGERQVASWMDKFQAAYQTLDNFLEKMDGWRYGFFSECFGDAIKHANDNEFVHLEAYQKRKVEIENAWCPTQEAIETAGKDVYYEELGASANKFVLTKMLMNLGNEGNARKLCCSYPSEALRGSSLWVFPDGLLTKDEAIAQTKENLLEFLGRVLTKEDIAYAQAKVDLAGMYWGEIADLERRTRGFTPKKVEAYPVTLKLANGEEVVFRGGYFPLIRNGEMGSHPVGILPVSETDAKQGKNVRTMYTDSGHTISRVEAEYPVDLTDGSEDWAMRKAIHDLCWRETMTDFRRILNDQVMFGLMKQKLGIADMTAFREMLEQAAQPNGGSSMAMGEGLLAQTAGWLRRKTVNSIVMLNLRINLQNFGNFFLYGNTVEGFGYSDVIAAMGNAFSRGFDGKSFSEMWAFVDEKSAFMRSRSENPDITLADLREEGKLNKFERTAMEWGAKAMMYTDGLTARPVWVQAYTKKINEGKTEQQAIDFADTIIRRTLGSGRVTDVASLQRGGPVYKLFTAFQGFFNTQFNQWVREYNIDKRLLAEGNTAEAVQRITAFVASKYLAACLFNLVLALEKPFDDDDDKYMNYTKELLHYPMSLIGIYGPIANFAMDKTLGMKAYSYRMSIIESSLDKVFRATGKLGKMVEGDFATGLEGLTDVAGIYAGVPAQMNRLFWNAWDIFVNGMDPELRDLATRRPKRER